MIRRLLVLLTLAPLACSYEVCADADADFVLSAPGDAVELIVHACGPRRNGLDLVLSLDADRTPAETLAIEVDGIGVSVDEHDGEWIGADSTGVASAADCDPGRRITIRRLDSDDTVAVSGSISVEISAPKRKTCSAEITVTPSP